MKKVLPLCLTLMFMVLLSALSGCNSLNTQTDLTNGTDATVITDKDTDKITETPDNTDKVTDDVTDEVTGSVADSETVADTEAPVDTSEKPNDKTYESAGIYASVLSNKEPYYEDEKEHYIFDNSEFPGYDYTHYTLLDMDGDGNEECLLQAMQLMLLLYHKDNVIYGDTFGFRAMHSVYKNGTFGWHGFSEVDGSQCYGLKRIRTFTPANAIETDIWRIDQVGTVDHRFYIGEDNRQVTQTEFDAYTAQYDSDEVEWIAL